jgi:hypothetical protein
MLWGAIYDDSNRRARFLARTHFENNIIRTEGRPYGISKKVTLRRCARFIDRAHIDPTRAIK